MKASDFIQLLEYGKAFKEPKPKRRPSKKDIDFTDLDINLLIHKKLQEAETLQKLLNDYEKAHKKEEKKEEKKDKDYVKSLAFFLVLSFPITAPMYVLVVKALFHLV